MHQDEEMQLHSSYFLTIILFFRGLDLCINNCILHIGAKPRNFHSKCITWIKITQQLDFGAITHTRGQLSCNTQLINRHSLQMHFGMIWHTGDISNLGLSSNSISELWFISKNATQLSMAPLIYQLLEFEVRITAHQTPSLINSAIRTILTCYLELYDRKTLLAHRIFWQSQLVNTSNLTPNQVAWWSLYYIMAVLTRIIIQHGVFSMDSTRMYSQTKIYFKM